MYSSHVSLRFHLLVAVRVGPMFDTWGPSVGFVSMTRESSPISHLLTAWVPLPPGPGKQREWGDGRKRPQEGDDARCSWEGSPELPPPARSVATAHPKLVAGVVEINPQLWEKLAVAKAAPSADGGSPEFLW